MDSPVRWENCHLQVLSYLLMIGTRESRDFSMSPQSKVVPVYFREVETSPLLSVLWNFTLPLALADIFQVLLREPAALVDTPSLLPESTPPEASSGTVTCKGEHKLLAVLQQPSPAV